MSEAQQIAGEVDEAAQSPIIQGAQTSQNPFDPQDVTFVGISPNTTKVRLLSTAIWLVLLLLGTIAVPVAVSVLGDVPLNPLAFVPALLPVGLGVWLLWLIPRQVRAWGYAEGANDLVIKHGIMFKTMVAVPYGRMQFVDVTQGPLERAFGIAGVKLHTASASSDAAIVGLESGEAARLRTVLTQRGEAQRAGL
ncbi:MAG: PH domain-containing protein [Actinomycetaceae bacterium]|nr:PH domain-containing protein [Actinomycetaceae bacterium]